MKILSFDTAMGACSAAVIDTGSRLHLASAYVQMERGHAEALPPMVAGVMKTADLRFSQIDRIAVTIGPGTFTGVRIGIAFARGLAQATGIPVVGIDTLSAIAANEAAVAAFLAQRIRFLDIARVVEDVLIGWEGVASPVESLQHVQAADLKARQRAEEICRRRSLTI